MTDYTFKVKLGGITEYECFKEASKDELKVLVALASLNGAGTTAESLAESLGLSKARVMAAVTLFEESGVLVGCSDGLLAEVEYEFEVKDDGESHSSLRAAEVIRNCDVRELNREMETLLAKTLSPREMARLTPLIESSGLSVEFLLLLTSHLKESRMRVSVEMIVREAKRLIEQEITTLEALEVYVRDKEEEVAGEREMCTLFGIRGRTLTKSERAFFKKWLHEFGYSGLIIGEAYDITVGATGNRSLSYIDKILTSWHENGCKTLEECRTRESIRKQENSKTAGKGGQRPKKSVEADTPKYTDFNSEDALLRALERSYGDSDGN
jgi:DnaD/phage-associated family protein